MLHDVPTRVDDPKDAVLWSVFDRLQKIDENSSSRVAFGSGILYAAQFGLDQAVFKDELAQLREILKIPPMCELPDNTPAPGPRSGEEAPVETTMRDL